MNTDPILQVTELHKQVDRGDGRPLTILEKVSFAVHPGETVAIVGASGSGKSTLLGLVAGLDLPSDGKVRLDGQSIFDLAEDERAQLRGRTLGFVFQSFQLLPDLDALDNVMLPLNLLGQERAEERARAALEGVGLSHRLRHTPSRMSGGEQQRVAIARALVVDPLLLLADEPTGNLDRRTGAQIIDLLFELNARRGTTLLLVTHDEHLASRCQRMLHMEAGSLEAA